MFYICKKYQDMDNYNIVEVVRLRFNEKCTFGAMFVNNYFQCYTLEPYFDPKFDGLKDFDFKAQKTVEKTYYKRYLCVPTGIYDLRLDIVSPLYLSKSWSKQFCGGKMPRVICPTHDGVLIHPGNYPKDTKGCVLVGNKVTKDGVFNSIQTFKVLYNKLRSFQSPIKIKFSYVR